ncbi:hypothetical protein [Geodermatophilus sp. SYSU D00815]
MSAAPGLVRPVGGSRTSPYELVPGPLFLVGTWVRELAGRWTGAPPALGPAAPLQDEEAR